MARPNTPFETVRKCCRLYSTVMTAPEAIAQIYVTVLPFVESGEGIHDLIAGLRPEDALKLKEATDAVLEAHDRFRTVDGFRLGSVLFDPATARASAHIGEVFVPSTFVSLLRETLHRRTTQPPLVPLAHCEPVPMRGASPAS